MPRVCGVSDAAWRMRLCAAISSATRREVTILAQNIQSTSGKPKFPKKNVRKISKKKYIPEITKLSAFEWYAPLVLSPPTPSNEPCVLGRTRRASPPRGQCLIGPSWCRAVSGIRRLFSGLGRSVRVADVDLCAPARLAWLELTARLAAARTGGGGRQTDRRLRRRRPCPIAPLVTGPPADSSYRQPGHIFRGM